jgi:salicylate hydroxylase
MVKGTAGRPLKVAIIGAGIGGLTAACALRQRGIEAEIYERASELGEVGAGLQLGPNSVKVLRAMGLEEALRRNAFEPNDKLTLHWDDASVREHESMKAAYAARYGAPYMTAHRPDLHRILRAGLPERHIRLEKTCSGVETRNGAGVARFTDGTEVEADIIIGADGIRSVVRQVLFGADEPRFARSIAWRCMIDIAHVPARVGPGGAVTLRRGDHFSWYGPNGQVICYPIGDGSKLNIFAGHASDDWVDESWSVPSSRQELIDAYRGWNEALLEMFRHVEHCFKWGIFDRDPRSEWTKGRVTLLGDAAHPTMPNLAQGANMAIEDGYVLARNLAKHASDPEMALQRYVAERQPRTSRITLQSRANFENSMKIPPAPPLDRSWIFEFDATIDLAS